MTTTRDPAAAEPRLTALRPTAPTDPAHLQAFSMLSELAVALLDVPRAFVTLVDGGREPWSEGHGGEAFLPIGTGSALEDLHWQQIARTGEVLVVRDTSEHPHLRGQPGPVGRGSWASVPFFDAAGAVLGALCVVDTRPRQWAPRELDTVATLALAAAAEHAAHLCTAALRRSEAVASELARTLQESLLPASPPRMPGLDIACRYLPAGTGVSLSGDFYDVFRLPGRGRTGLTIGDVSGHGVEAAKVTSLARHTIRATAMTGAGPEAVLLALNHELLSQDAPLDTEPRFLTATHAQLRRTPRFGVVRVASAGHCPTLLKRADGRVDVLATEGLPLGWFADPRLRGTRTVLRPGDALVVYTDGISEARREGVVLGDDAILDLVHDAPAGCDAAELAARVEQVSVRHGGPQPQDDAAVMVVRLLPAHELPVQRGSTTD